MVDARSREIVREDNHVGRSGGRQPVRREGCNLGGVDRKIVNRMYMGGNAIDNTGGRLVWVRDAERYTYGQTGILEQVRRKSDLHLVVGQPVAATNHHLVVEPAPCK